MAQERDAMLGMEDGLYRCTPEYELLEHREPPSQPPSPAGLVDQEHGAAHELPSAAVYTQTAQGLPSRSISAQEPFNATLGALLLHPAENIRLFDDQQGLFTFFQSIPRGSDHFLQSLFQCGIPVRAQLFPSPDGLQLALTFSSPLWPAASSEAVNSTWAVGVADVLTAPTLSHVPVPEEGHSRQPTYAPCGLKASMDDVILDSASALSGIVGAGEIVNESYAYPESVIDVEHDQGEVARQTIEHSDTALPNENLSIEALLRQKLEQGICWCGYQLKGDERQDNAYRHWRDSCPKLPSVEILLTLLRMYQPPSATSTIRSLIKKGQDLYGDDAVMAEAVRQRKLIKRFESLGFGSAQAESVLDERTKQLKSQWSDHLKRGATQPRKHPQRRQQKTSQMRPGTAQEVPASVPGPVRSQRSHLPQNYPYPVAMPEPCFSAVEPDRPWDIQPSFDDISNQFGQESRYCEDPFDGLLTEPLEDLATRILAIAASPSNDRRGKRRRKD